MLFESKQNRASSLIGKVSQKKYVHLDLPTHDKSIIMALLLCKIQIYDVIGRYTNLTFMYVATTTFCNTEEVI